MGFRRMVGIEQKIMRVKVDLLKKWDGYLEIEISLVMNIKNTA